jgi:hypothetical protein
LDDLGTAHEFESPYNGLMVHEPHRKAAVEDKIPQTIGSDAIRCQQMEGFSEDRDGRTERFLYCFERILALLMFCVLPIKHATNGPVSRRIIYGASVSMRRRLLGAIQLKAQSHIPRAPDLNDGTPHKACAAHDGRRAPARP